jgi:hypothetical protein
MLRDPLFVVRLRKDRKPPSGLARFKELRARFARKCFGRQFHVFLACVPVFLNSSVSGQTFVLATVVCGFPSS